MVPSTATTTASHLNNEGVNLIEAGLYQEAIACFSKGLSIAKEVLASQADEEDDEDGPDDADSMDISSDSASQTPSCHFHKIQEQEAMNSCDTKEEVYSDGPFLFRSPIFIPSSQANDVASFKYYVKCSFILLYNLALTHHLSALEGSNTTKRLRKALSLYELAYTIQMTEDIQLTVLQTMAIVNNLGLVHTALKNEAKATQCFQHLLSTIMFLTDCDERDSVEQIDGFVSNVMPLILKGSASAAAA